MSDVDPMLGAKPEPEPNLNQPAEQKEADQPPPPPLDILSFRQLKDLKPASPLVDGLIYHDTLAQMSGAPGCGKSFVAIGMACAVAMRESSWEGHKIRNAGNVLYVAAEGVTGIRHRASAWARLAGHHPDDLDQKLFVVRGAVQMHHPDDQQALVDAIRDLDIVFVIFDTRHRCTTGLDENDAKDQGRAIAGVESVRAQTGVTVLVVHHTGKGAVATPRGSTAWSGAVWSDLLIKKTDRRVSIKIEKHKEVESGHTLEYDLKAVVVEEEDLPNASEQQRTTLVAIAANGNEMDGGMLTGTENRIITLLDETAGQEGITRTQIGAFLAERGEAVSQSALYAAVRTLEKTNKIRAVNPGKRGTRYTTQPVITD